MLLGKDATLYYWTGAAWALVSNVMDLDYDDPDEEFEVSTRGTGGFVMTAQTLTKVEIKFKMLHDPTAVHDAGWGIFKTAKEAKTGVRCRIMDRPQATSGARGLDATFIVSQMNKSQPLKGAQVDDVVLKPTFGTDPTYVVI